MIKNILIITFLILFTSCKGGVDRSVIKSSPVKNISYYFSKRGVGIDDLIVDDIKGATSKVRVAIYNLSEDKITNALIYAKNQGVDVKVVTEDSHKNNASFVTLRNNGILVYDDNKSSALMHDKFLVIDDKIVWSGSSNYTEDGFYNNNENDVRIVDRDLAKVYSDEFDMIVAKNQQNHYFESPNMKLYFSPRGGIESRLISLINSANSSIEFLIFAFTSSKVADAIVDAENNRSVEVMGVFDKVWDSGNQAYSKYNYLKSRGIDVLRDSNPYTLHDKVMIIDDSIVITGSYNYTKSANNKNAENILILYDTEIAKKYKEEFEKIYSIGVD